MTAYQVFGILFVLLSAGAGARIFNTHVARTIRELQSIKVLLLGILVFLYFILTK